VQKIQKIVLTSTLADDILRFVVEETPRQHNSSKETWKDFKKVVDKVWQIC